MDNFEDKKDLLNRLDLQSQRLEEMENAINSLKSDLGSMNDMLKSYESVLKDTGKENPKDSGVVMNSEIIDGLIRSNLGMTVKNINESLKRNVNENLHKQDSKIEELLSKSNLHLCFDYHLSNN